MDTSASMALQTPNVMRWTRHMDECLEILDISDKVVCAHVRLQHIVEEFEAQLSSALALLQSMSLTELPSVRLLSGLPH